MEEVIIDKEELEILQQKSIMLENMSAWFVSYVFDKYQYTIKDITPFFIYWFFINKLEKAITFSSEEHYANLKTNIFAFNIANGNDNEDLDELMDLIKQEVNNTINAEDSKIKTSNKEKV
tara:strand:+ start:3810 stop:4169 length:360 start_codon:yes stop_codon:yes gene_type:complete